MFDQRCKVPTNYAFKTFMILICAAAATFAQFDKAEARELDTATLQASDQVPVNDNRIAELWSALPALDNSQGIRVRRDCTASYLGENFWLTAHHCISNSPLMDGFLRQSDGEVAGIAAIYTKSSTDDVALIKVGPGIDADPFDLANTQLAIGEKATLTGYGQPHDYASSATTIIREQVPSLDFGNVIYTDLFKGMSAALSRSCSGDSGAPIYVGNTLYAVHTAGGFNPGCTDGHDMPMWHTNIVSRKSWVSTTRRLNSQFSDMEKEKAAVGLRYSAGLFPSAPGLVRPSENNYPAVKSSSFQQSSTKLF